MMSVSRTVYQSLYMEAEITLGSNVPPVGLAMCPPEMPV